MGIFVKKTLNRLMKSESGFALPLVLVLLLLGGLIISPLLGYMSTGIIVGEQKEQMMERLYTADAGVEDALWYLISVNSTLESLTFPVNWIVPNINGNSADVTIEKENDLVLKITSEATNDDGSTIIETHVEYIDFSGILNNVATSPNEIDPQGGGEATPELIGTVNGTYTDDWPTAEQLSAYFLRFVDTIEDNYTSDTIDINSLPEDIDGNKIIGPLYRDGDLTITSQNGPAGMTLKLEGTIYVTGLFDMATTNKNFNLNLNGHTIFVRDDSTSTDPDPAMEIGSKCTLTTGSGCLIAVGYIYLQPKIDTTEGDFLFIMSVEDVVRFQPQPNSYYYGSIAGNVEVELWPGGTFEWEEWYECDDEGENCHSRVNFPNGYIKVFEILDWLVSS